MSRKSSNASRMIRERLRAARGAAGLSQAAAAQLLHRPQWFVSRSETGARRVSVDELVEFARVYHKRLADFLEGLLD